MATFLFDKIIFGPVNSRRLGISLGINLLPINYKICNFNCLYCECGLNTELKNKSPKSDLPSRQKVKSELASVLKQMFEKKGQTPDVITFAGNGEPTMHPEFSGIIGDTIELRDQICPSAKIAVLTNATLLRKASVFNALCRIDQNIIKLDSCNHDTADLLNQPVSKYNIPEQIKLMKQFNGRCIVQTMFTAGEYKNTYFDNTTTDEINGLIEAYKAISPQMIMIYTISRDTPIDSIKKISKNELDKIANIIRENGFEVQVSY